jgi:hypothetical protein
MVCSQLHGLSQHLRADMPVEFILRHQLYPTFEQISLSVNASRCVNKS